jgi:hypothetical protein
MGADDLLRRGDHAALRRECGGSPEQPESTVALVPEVGQLTAVAD